MVVKSLLIITVTSCVVISDNLFAQERKWDYRGKATTLSALSMDKQVAIVRIGPEDKGLWGIIDNKTGAVIVEPKYNEMSDIKNYGIACVKLGDKYGYIDWTGKGITPIKYDKPSFNIDDALPDQRLPICVREGGQFVKNDEGETCIKEQKFGYIDETGKEIITPKYSYGKDFFLNSGKYIARVYNGKCDINGWTLCMGNHEKLTCGIIDTSGKIVIPFNKYKDIYGGIGDILIGERLNGQYDIFHGIKGEVTSTQYTNYEKINHKNYYKVTIKNNDQEWYGITDSDFKTIIPPKYTKILEYVFNDNTVDYIAIDGDDVYFLAEHGNLLTDKQYQYADEIYSPYYSNLWSFDMQTVIDKNSHLYGYINKNGAEVIKCQFKKAKNFDEKTGLAIVCNSNDKWGTINVSGKLVIPFIYDNLKYLDNKGYYAAYVKKTGTIGQSGDYNIVYINSKGNEIDVHK